MIWNFCCFIIWNFRAIKRRMQSRAEQSIKWTNSFYIKWWIEFLKENRNHFHFVYVANLQYSNITEDDKVLWRSATISPYLNWTFTYTTHNQIIENRRKISLEIRHYVFWSNIFDVYVGMCVSCVLCACVWICEGISLKH